MFLLTQNVRCKVYEIGNPEDHIKSIFKQYKLDIDIKVAINDKNIYVNIMKVIMIFL